MSVLEDDPLLAKGSDHHPSVEDMTVRFLSTFPETFRRLIGLL